MRNVSNLFKKDMEARRDFYCQAEITFADGTVKQLGKDDFAMSGNGFYEGAGSGSFPLGLLIPKHITLTLNNYDDRWSEYDFQWARVFLKTKFDLSDGTTESINIGNFTVVTPESYGIIVEVTAVDDSYKLDREYRSSLPYPASIGSILRDSCLTCGVSLLSTSFKNDSFVVKNKPEGITHRQVVGLCAMLAGGNARFDGYNRLVVVPYDFSELRKPGLDGGEFDLSTGAYQTGDRLDGGSFSPWNAGGSFEGGTFGDRNGIHVLYAFQEGLEVETDDVVITGVNLKSDGYDGAFYGDDGYVLSVENALAAGNELDAVDLIGESVVGLRFRPFSGSHVPYPLAEFGDPALVIDRKNNVYKTVITDFSFPYYGLTEVGCSADSPIRNSSRYNSEAAKAIVESKKLVEKEKTEREQAMEELASELAQSSGLYMTEDAQEDGSTIYYMHDKPTLAESMIVWKLTAEAFGISTDGGKTYPYGLDVTGLAILNRIYAIGINCDYLTAGAFEIRKGDKVMVLMDKDTGHVILRPDVFELSNGETIGSIAESAASEAVEGQTQEDIFNKLFKPGGVLVEGVKLEDGKIYISASYIYAGEMSADRIKGGNLAIGGDTDGITMDGKKISFLSDGEEYGHIESYYGSGKSTPGINISSDYGGVLFRVNSSSRGQPKLTYSVAEILSYEAFKGLYGSSEKYYPVRLGLNGTGVWIGTVKVDGASSFGGTISYDPTSKTSSVTAVFDNGKLYKSSSSSKRYKDIGERLAEKDIDNLYNITPVWAKYKDGYLGDGDERCGVEHPMFIAEDVEKYAPLAVDHNEEGLSENWNYRVMVPYMFQMLKSQKEKIDELENRVRRLEEGKGDNSHGNTAAQGRVCEF